MKKIVLIVLLPWFLGACSGDSSDAIKTASSQSSPRVVIFVIDGLMPDTALVASKHGAENLAMIFNEGVTVETAYSVSPAHRLKLPNGDLPWGESSAPNVALHTGCHIFESRDMDDIFKAARLNHIESIFIGGSNAYKIFDTADFYFAGTISDAAVIDMALEQIKTKNPKLVRLHLQRIRDDWTGPGDRVDPNSNYVQSVVNADRQLGRLIDYLKSAKEWENTYFIVAADHGMGRSTKSTHPANEIESWQVFMGFLGPNIKKGTTIPYAESPDLAVLAVHLLKMEPLRGHAKSLTYYPEGATGTLLASLFVDHAQEIDHPRPIEHYLKKMNYEPLDDYLEYREAMIDFFEGRRLGSGTAGVTSE